MCSKGYLFWKAASILGRLAGGRGRQEMDGRCCGMDVGNGGQGWVNGVDVGGDALGVHNSQ